MSDQNDISIRPANRNDAPFLGRAVTGALGEKLCLGLAGSPDRLYLVDEMFLNLAAMDESQYSYRNAIIAETSDGIIGAIIGYDGALLHTLRKAFVREACKTICLDIDEKDMKDEAESGEIYLDTLYIEPSYRGKGIGSALIKAMIQRHSHSQKPFGLLVEPEKQNARNLYEKLGFRQVDINHAFIIPMIHMQHPPITADNSPCR